MSIKLKSLPEIILKYTEFQKATFKEYLATKLISNNISFEMLLFSNSVKLLKIFLVLIGSKIRLIEIKIVNHMIYLDNYLTDEIK